MTRKLIYILIFAFIVFGIYACTNNPESSEVASAEELKLQTTARVNSLSDTLSIDMEEDSYRVVINANINENYIHSTFKVWKSETELFSIIYDYDTSEQHWKLKQAPQIIQKANLLQNISPEIVLDIKNILDKSFDSIYLETIDNKNIQLVSILNYYNSILNSRIRANTENADCNCSVNPFFINDKSFFSCQEERYYNVAKLKLVLNDYLSNNELDAETSNLVSFLNSTTKSEIRFDDYYDFYFPKEEFKQFVNDVAENNANSRCWLGSGSSYGCCGNYSGCCLYKSPVCSVHDAMCSQCDKWYCGPQCKPDKPVKSINSLSIF